MAQKEVDYKNCDFWENHHLILNGKHKTYDEYFLLKGELRRNNSFFIENIFGLVPIDIITDIKNDNPHLTSEMKKIQLFQASHEEKESLFLGKITISQLDPIPGAVWQPEEIVKEIVNMLLITVLRPMKWILFQFWNESASVLFDKNLRDNPVDPEFSNYVKKNITALCKLTHPQYILIQKGLQYIHKSLSLRTIDKVFSFVAMISAIEPISEKYSDFFIRKSKNESPYHNKFTEILMRGLNTKVDENLTNNIIKDLDSFIISTEYFNVKKKFIDFCYELSSSEYQNSLLEEMLDDVYYLRSIILHGADDAWLHQSDNKEITFNRYSRTGKLREDGDITRVIPSYLFLLRYFLTILVNLINYFIEKKPDDTQLYSRYDLKEKHVVIVKMAPDKIPEPGCVVFQEDIDAQFNYLHAYVIKKFFILDSIKQSVDGFPNIFNNFPIDADNDDWVAGLELVLKIHYLKKDYLQMDKIFTKYPLVITKPIHHRLFNSKIYREIERGNFKDAHDIISTLLSLPLKDHQKSNLIDSRGDIFNREGRKKEAYSSYYEALEMVKGEKLSSFHEETLQKIVEVGTELNVNESILTTFRKLLTDNFPKRE